MAIDEKDETPRKRIINRLSSLKQERSTWDSHWTELSDYVEPRRSRFSSSERNQGSKKNENIVNDTATWSARVLASGMMSGITSPARPWFRLTTPDPDLAELGPVKEWLAFVERRLMLAFERSNIYRCLQEVYLALATPGTAVLHVDDDDKSLIRGYALPIGQYCLANDGRLAVDTLFREPSLTMRQMVQKFGLEACSQRTQQASKAGRHDEWVDLVHAIAPNSKQEPERADARGMAWNGTWLETNAEDESGVLDVRGYPEMPFMAARWAVTGEDVYSSSNPGMQALGDVKALQALEKSKAQAAALIARPPTQAPFELQGRGGVSLLPGDSTYVSGAGVIRSVVEISPQALPAMSNEIARHEERIKRAYYADLWLTMIRGQNDPQKTATEVAALKDEQMLQLGPVLEGLEDDLLDPLVSRAFGILMRRGYFPPPPQELQGMDIRVQYISMLAQAQRLLGITAVDRLTSFVVNLAVNAQRPELLDKLDLDQGVDIYADMLGTPPRLVRTDEAVQAIRDQRAKAQQAAQQQEQMMAAAQGAKTLSEADTGSDNALTRMLGNMGAPTGAQ